MLSRADALIRSRNMERIKPRGYACRPSYIKPNSILLIHMIIEMSLFTVLYFSSREDLHYNFGQCSTFSR